MLYRWRSFASGRYGRHALNTSYCRRAYSSHKLTERVDIPCQSNGTIALDIHHPLKPTSELSSPSTALIYLPRGPYMQNEREDASTISILRSHLHCPVVQINYRLSREQQYPTPIHDVLCGYDWVLENLLPRRAFARVGRSQKVGRLAVCGELIGGGLAAMLALTECRIGEPGIVAAAVSSPLMDWVSLTKEAPRPSRGKKGDLNPQSISDVERDQLVALRARLFSRPEGYFDPFASPILFFRSAGVGIPPAPPTATQDDMEQLSRLEREGFSVGEDIHDAASSLAPVPNQIGDPAPHAMRKVSRRFPSKTLRLRLPSFHVSSETTSPLREQTEEFTKQFGKSMARQSLGLSDFGRKVLLNDEEDSIVGAGLDGASDRVHSRTYDGDGLWDDSAAGRERVLEVAKWLKDAVEGGG